MKNKKSEKLALIPILIVISLMAIFLLWYVFDGKAQEKKTYMVGASNGWSCPKYITSSDTIKIDSFITSHLGMKTNAVDLCNENKSYIYIETQKTRVYLVSGIIRKKKNGKEKFISTIPHKGIKRNNIKGGNKKRY